MATLSALSSSLRSELGDTARSFVDVLTGDGSTARFQLSQAPVQGSTLSVNITTPASTAVVTGASASLGVITYVTPSNNFVVGQQVTITGLSTTAFNLTNVLITGVTATGFTVASSATGTAITNAPSAQAVASINTQSVSSTAIIEEGTGVLTLAVAPVNGAIINISGQAYRYFTDSDIAYFINTAFTQHAGTETTSLGSSITQLAFLPPIEEYPLTILASTLALYTLATDAAFDIDILSPDGVNIPRTERYRQLMEIVQTRKEQYKELCAMLNVGLYRIEVASLRRISRLTNRYVPIYRPQEVDDWSLPQRVMLPMPTYGDVTPPEPIMVQDLEMYSGDDFAMEFGFTFDLTNYTPASEIVLYQNSDFSQVGPVVLGTFSITKVTPLGGSYPSLLKMTLPSSVTERLPRTSYYDLRLTDQNGLIKTYFGGKVHTFPSVTNSSGYGVV